MNLLHINSYYNGGGFYKNLYDIQDNKLNIKVYLPVHKGFSSKFDFGKYTSVREIYSSIERIFFHLKHYKILKDVQKKYDIKKFDLIHAHSLFSNGHIAMKLKQKYGVPYVVAVRNADVNVFFKYMFHLRKIGISIMKEADAIIFLSQAYSEFVLSRYIDKNVKANIESKIHIIPNGVHPFWLNNIITQKKMHSEKLLKLLFIGDINKNKNALMTIEAIKILRQEGYNVDFTIIGKILDKNLYLKLMQYNFVKYIPFKSKEALLEIYRQHHIFIMPSITETFGLVYVEAMTQGLPVIYSRGQGFDRQFNEGVVGYSVQSSCYDDIVVAVKKILDNYDEISYNCTTNCYKFDWVYIERDYDNLYKEIMQMNI